MWRVGSNEGLRLSDLQRGGDGFARGFWSAEAQRRGPRRVPHGRFEGDVFEKIGL